MIQQIGIDKLPYFNQPDEDQQFVGWFRNGTKKLSGGNADGDYSGTLNQPIYHVYRDVEVTYANLTQSFSKINEIILEVNSLSDLFDGIGDYTDMVVSVQDLQTDISNLQNSEAEINNNITSIQDEISNINDNYNSVSQSVDNITIAVGENSQSISVLSNSVGVRNADDITNRSALEDIYWIKQEIGNYEDYDINGNVELGNAATGVKLKINNALSLANSNEQEIDSLQTDTTKLQQQVGSDVIGSETGLELRTKTIETEMDRILSYGGVRLSSNSSATPIADAGTFVSLVVDSAVAMPVNRSVTTSGNVAVITTSGGAYLANANVLLENIELSDQWVHFQIYVNGLPTGIMSYTKLHSDGRGYVTMSEPLLLEDEDEIELRVTLPNSTGNLTVEDFSLFVTPM